MCYAPAVEVDTECFFFLFQGDQTSSKRLTASWCFICQSYNLYDLNLYSQSMLVPISQGYQLRGFDDPLR